MSIKFPEGKDKLLIFEITMKPDEGIYRCPQTCDMTNVFQLIVCCMPGMSSVTML